MTATRTNNGPDVATGLPAFNETWRAGAGVADRRADDDPGVWVAGVAARGVVVCLWGVRGWVWPGQLRELPRVPHTQKPSSPYSQDVGPPCQNVERRGSVQRSRSGQVTNAPSDIRGFGRPQDRSVSVVYVLQPGSRAHITRSLMCMYSDKQDPVSRLLVSCTARTGEHGRRPV